jgi:hypothetical protein
VLDVDESYSKPKYVDMKMLNIVDAADKQTLDACSPLPSRRRRQIASETKYGGK